MKHTPQIDGLKSSVLVPGVTVLVGGVLDAVGPVCVVDDLAVRQSSGWVPDLGLHVVSSPPAQSTGVHREVRGGFSENGLKKKNKHRLDDLFNQLRGSNVTRMDRPAPSPSTPGPNTLILEVSTAGSTTTLAGNPGTALPPYFSIRVYMPEVRGT